MRAEEQNVVELLKDYGFPSGKAIDIVVNANDETKTLLALIMMQDARIQSLDNRLSHLENKFSE